jgi:regulator of sirC expression with transglutaminase-like and TPR domain
LIQPDKSILHKNLSAIQCRTGKYNEAVAPALRVLQLDPEDDMGHRNMALIREALGDSKSALDHNLTSIMLQQKNRQPPNPKAFRAAAGKIIIQMIF